MNQARVEVSLGLIAQCVFQGEVLVRGIDGIDRETVEMVIEGPLLPPPAASGALPKVMAMISEQKRNREGDWLGQANIEFKPIG